MLDAKHTDEAPVEPQVQTEEVLEVEDLEPEVEPSKPSDELDFDEILSKSKTSLKSKEERKGLSRKEVAKIKSEADEDEDMSELLETVKELKEFKSQFTEDAEYVRQFREKSESSRSEDLIREKLKAENVDAAMFNEVYKTAFVAKREELESKGLTQADAVSLALDLVVAPLKRDEAVRIAEDRARGRKDAGLPHASTSGEAPQEAYPLLSLETYSNLVSSRGADYFKKYNAHWANRGVEKPWKEAAA